MRCPLNPYGVEGCGLSSRQDCTCEPNKYLGYGLRCAIWFQSVNITDLEGFCQDAEYLTRDRVLGQENAIAISGKTKRFKDGAAKPPKS